ncbi:MAG: GtrA family protein [Methylobacter sp.]|uniref:DUF6311 domain-containing protein n=1 Tax=Methylobacter sp. TaxID=2051955 RepID=UPI00258ADD03|nr:DUF6311 domain-containing protein [Methylobacter sp.]MCL7420744.1 GtrA family protein [Methylobacter sp.]
MNVKTLSPVLTRQALRFALSGLLVTSLHVFIATTFIQNILPISSLANGVAFVVANIFSYLINTTWSFSSSLHGRNLFRFCIVSAIGLFLAMAISGATQHYGLHYWYGIAFVVSIVPPVTFLLHNFWTYRTDFSMDFGCSLKLPVGSFLSIMLGLAIFLSITGGRILWPTNIDWLMKGDPATHWLGWQFFRYSPFFQWPIGANPNYGMSIGSSIVFTDSIPLLAFIFKPLSAFLPDTFQYIGLWILICFLLQAYFSWKLLTFFTQDKWLPLIGSTFFTIAPVCLWRLHGHYALFGHWVLLAGLCLYFTKSFSIFRWISLLVATVLIHAYLLVMVLAIYAADLIQRCCLKQMAVVKALCIFFVAGICITFIMWAAGYFMLGTGVGGSGFGFFRMNLLSLIDPDDSWSKLLRDQKGGEGDYEGFNYLGLGMLGLGLMAGYEWLCNVKVRINAKVAPLLIISIGLFLYAISNRVAIGPYEIFSYELPSITEGATSTFRVSGRFFWPVYYLLYLAIFYLLFIRLRPNVAILICMVMLFFQVADSSDIWSTFRNKFARFPKWSSPMQSPIWNDIAYQYRKIIFVLPHNMSANWLPLSRFAALHHMSINTGYFARVNPENEHKAKIQITSSILNNELDPDSLYVFEEDGLWKLASSEISSSDVAGVLDGFRIVAPHLKDCRNCDQDAIANIVTGNSHDIDYMMTRVSFASNGTGLKYLLYGWSQHEPWGTWSDGDTSVILLTLSELPKNDVELLIEGHAFLTDKHSFQEIDVLVNEQYMATLRYEYQFNNRGRAVKIPLRLISENNGQLLIKFNFKNAKSPTELGLSGDRRRLGLGIVSLELKSI